jgi:cytochrome c-type biogenesis protein CcmH/NrfG
VTPKDAEPYYELGLVQLQLGDVAGAANALRKATELNPKQAQAQLKLSQLMVASHNKTLVQDAANRLKDILAWSPNNPDALDTLAGAEFQLGKQEEATKQLEEALQKFPAHLQSSVSLARLKLSQNDPSAAEEVLKQATAQAPQHRRKPR